MRPLLFAALLLMAAGPPDVTPTDATGVLGRMVVDAEGKEIGRILDVVVDGAGQPRAIVVDAGGFMGLGSRRVAVAWTAVHVPSPAAKDRNVVIDLTDEQVRTAPDYSDRTKPAPIVSPQPGQAPATLPADAAAPTPAPVAAPAPAPVPPPAAPAPASEPPAPPAK